MIKTGIIGAGQRVAGELIRLLVNHPDIDLITVMEPSRKGSSVSSIHHGLIGETSLDFSDAIDPADLDLVFVCTHCDEGEALIADPDQNPDLCVVDMTGSHLADLERLGMAYGLSEMNRKPLVRGAKRAALPTPIAAVALIGLYPLAANLLLRDDLSLRITVPSDLADRAMTTRAASEIATRLHDVQQSFEGSVRINVSRILERRGIRVTLSLPTDMQIDDIERLYESIYDDHNFTFLTSESADFDEVEGTQKCLISLTKPNEGTLAIDIVADSRMRGGAGDAMHVLNLLFGLHERTGLALKASTY